MSSWTRSEKSIRSMAVPAVVLAVVLFAGTLGSAGTVVGATLSDQRNQTFPGQDFVFTFSPVEPSDGTDGVLRIHARGDYSIADPDAEFLTWDIEGLASGVAAPAYGTVIQEYNYDDVEWEQSFPISGSVLTQITADSVVSILTDLSSNVDVFGPSFVEVELTFGSVCLPPPEPNYPDPCDGATGVAVDTCLSWDTHICDIELPNGGFESGLFAPWTIVTGPGGQLQPWQVSNGSTGYFGNGWPYEGFFFAQNGFDGDAGLFYDLYQEVALPSNASSLILEWSERIQWDMVGWGATLPRDYVVSLQPSGGGPALAVLYTRSLNPGTSGDTGYVQHSVDLLSVAPGIASQTVRINFHESVPQTYTGPAQFDLDGVSLSCNGRVLSSGFPPAPQSSERGLQNLGRLKAEYDRLREAAIAGEEATASVRTGTESSEAKDGTALEAGSGSVGVMNTGGPDCGGYVFVDSTEPGGPQFDWIEISGTGTNLNLSDDTYYWPINLSFNFDFYGVGHNQVAVGSNGTIHFVGQYMTYGNTCIPGTNSSGINSFVAIYWDDLYPSGTENVYWEIVGTAPNRILVVQWHNVRHWGSSTGWVTAQAQLFETSGDILLLYQDPSSEAGVGATVGIQRDPTCGLQYSCNQSCLSPGLAVRFTRGDQCWGANVLYDVYLGRQPDELELISECNDICERTCCPNEPLFGDCTEYYWQVVATNRCGSSTAGRVWSFSTEGVCNQPPDCNSAVPSVATIWPPNHRWVDIEILDVNDPDPCDTVSITITGITQDEPVIAPGSGNAFPDGAGVGTGVARVRAERCGHGNGRVYRISFEASDDRGGVCSGAVDVCVPHDMGAGGQSDTVTGSVCEDDGQLYDSTASEMIQVDINRDGIVNMQDFTLFSMYWLTSYEIDY